jgi:hypothetical protein
MNEALPQVRPAEVPAKPIGPAAWSLQAEAFVTGLIGAAAIAVWFFILDCIRAQPFYTPSVLGTALFQGREALGDVQHLPVSWEMVALWTWVHVLAFVILGGALAWCVRLAEKDPGWGFGLLLLGLILLGGIHAFFSAFAEDVLHALTIPAIYGGNLLAGAAMALFLWWRHPKLTFHDY